ncbi:microphthalmia-associated transcription factor-like isoform X2 [Petromyzon marinus]|uniref:Microphthalmia-associated transcription factor-like isoform X2 n=1 Tax=Petromyzon marinus TaxID=7757 RepID=A0AAJ7U3K2_PETMA|nr:microphthalmia-associated transcription factor-like isoform X2 [Petromyzon marinus]
MGSRILLRQQLMKDQLCEEERRTQQQQQQQQQQNATFLPGQQRPSAQTPAINVQVPAGLPKAQVPVQVLKVQTNLENPTKYHIQQSQHQQVKQYLTTTLGTKVAHQVLAISRPSAGSAPNMTGAAAGTAGAHVSPGQQQQQQFATTAPTAGAMSAAAQTQSVSPHGSAVLLPGSGSGLNSPMALLNINNNESSEREMEDVIDDIISLESSFNDEMFSLVDASGLPLSNTLPVQSNGLEVYGSTGVVIPGITLTSTSCPANLAPVKLEVVDEHRVLVKERQKKDNHNLIERRRRFNINDRIKELGLMIPKSNDPDMRWNKGTILKASVDYIRKLQKEQQRLREADSRQKKLEQTNRGLLLRIQELELQASTHGLPLSSPSGLNTAELMAQVGITGDVSAGSAAFDLGRHNQPPSRASSDAGGLDLDSVCGFSSGGAFSPALSFGGDGGDGGMGGGGGGDVLMDELMSPLGPRDPLLCALSPGATSKTSSRRSSFSMDDGDM